MLLKKKRQIRFWFLALFVAPALGVGLFLALFDANTYRDRIAAVLSQNLGREVKLGGEMRMGFSLTEGFSLSVENVSFANSVWASRPKMAQIGQVSLGVRLLPLIQKKLEIASFTLKEADIQLEQNKAGQKNWDFFHAVKTEEKPCAGKECGMASMAVSMSIDFTQIEKTRLAMRDADGVLKIVDVASMRLQAQGSSTTLKFKGKYNDLAVTFDLEGGPLANLLGDNWPFKAQGYYGLVQFMAEGALKKGLQEIDISSYRLKADVAAFEGNMNVQMGGVRPFVRGTVKAGRLDLDAYSPVPRAQRNMAPAIPPQEKESAQELRVLPKEHRLFSTKSLDFSALKASDLDIAVNVDEIYISKLSLRDVVARLKLQNGRLIVAPLSLVLADSKAEGVLKMDASGPVAEIATVLKAHQVDIPQLAQLGGLESFIVGKGDVDFDISTRGQSPHDLAFNANGSFNLIAAGGTLSSKVLEEIAVALVEVFAPGKGDVAKGGMNCFAARFLIENGNMRTNGVLLDTAQATVAVTGGLDFGREETDLFIRSRAKAAEVLDIIPAVRMKGSLLDPKVKIDANSSLQKVAGLFLGKGSATDESVPDVIVKEGQNACVYTLDHPQPAKETRKGSPSRVPNKEEFKEMGNDLLKGLFGTTK